MKVARGTSVFSGIAIGPLKLFRRREAQISRNSDLTPEAEFARFQRARDIARQQLGELYQRTLEKLGEDAAAIFEIHQMMLEDEDYVDAVREALEGQGATAEWAAIAAGERFAAAFSAMEDSYMRARSADVRDVSRRVADILTGTEGGALQGEEPAILMADDLTPSETVQLDRSRLLGFLTRRGSVNSHTAILARTMGIPALVGVDFQENWEGETAVLDGEGGRVYIDPTEELRAAMEARLRAGQAERALLQGLRGKANVTLDGREIRVCANISGAEDVEGALQNDAQGVGLFRSEFLYLERADLPGEEEQLAVYRRVVQAMAGKKVIIRTLDVGADKQAPCFQLEREENPALGYRAIRICLTRREVFKTQLRAILRASAFGCVSVMFPMIISVGEVRAARALLEECRTELEAGGIPVGRVEVGIMVETPAAVMIADELAREVDFFSLGTNDLTQYTLAIDRQNPRLDAFYDPRHPAILRMIRQTVEAGHRHGCWVGICGELGADPALTEAFLRMGVDELSVAPSAILPLRRHIRGLDLREPPGAGGRRDK